MKTAATITKLEEVTKLQASLPKSWYKAAGLLRHKRKALAQHTRRVRQEWSSSQT